MRDDITVGNYPMKYEVTLGRAAIMLAMSGSRENEEILKKYFTERGFKCGVTEMGGITDEIKRKIVNSVVGAALNLNIIQKKPTEIHALVHASIEASYGLMLDIPINLSLHIKIAIVKKDTWVTVAMYGDLAGHSLANHERIGLGTMHI